MFFEQTTIIFQLLFAMFLGIVVGADREIVGKEAGIKTYSLVAVGSTMFTILSMNPIFPDNGRIISQIIVGIGFIGAGLIIFHQNKVHGLTTAAALWVMAAIGVAIGMEYYFLAAFGTAIIMIVLFGFRILKLEERIHKINRS
ncbi:MAG: MgtC/SapB family protein [Patescibacteria group bacterium]